MRINHNISSLVTQGSLFRTNRSMSKSLQKLSTGIRINTAADDAAGLGVSENLRTQVRGIGQALKNTQDAISMLNIAEGALNEQSSILQRMRELVVEAKNDTYTQTERNYMGDEFLALVDELDRIAATTNFNGMQLFATWDDNISTNTDPKSVDNGGTNIFADSSKAVFGADDNTSIRYFNMMVGANYTSADSDNYNQGVALSFEGGAENFITLQLGQMDASGLLKSGAVTGDTNTIQHDLQGPVLNLNPFDTKSGAYHINRWGDDLQSKFNQLLKLIDGEDADAHGTVTTSLETGDNVTGFKRINRMRAYIGAMTNRLEHNLQNLMSSQANQQSAESVIRDVDFAEETAKFTKGQILTQSATSMLAQANMRPQMVLSLIG